MNQPEGKKPVSKGSYRPRPFIYITLTKLVTEDRSVVAKGHRWVGCAHKAMAGGTFGVMELFCILL